MLNELLSATVMGCTVGSVYKDVLQTRNLIITIEAFAR
jgi:hypothetical protein